MRIRDARVSSVQVSDRTVWRHITLTSTDGVVGTGEYTIGMPNADLDDRAGAAAQALIGRRVDQINGPALAAEWGGDFAAWTISSAADQAAGDLSAAAASQPLAKALNQAATLAPVKLYANINRRTVPRTPDNFAQSARDALAAGHNALKVAPFDDVTSQNCQSRRGLHLTEAGLDRIRAVADEAGHRAEVMVDCHWRFSFERCSGLIDTLADIGVVWFECPIAETPDTISQLRRLRSHCENRGMRLAGCETMTGAGAFHPFIAGGAYDVVMPDVKHAGGLRELMRIADDAAAHGVACSLHNPTGPIAHLHSVHVAAAIGAAERLETQFDESPLFLDLTNPPPQLVGDTAVLTDAPGIGLRLTKKGGA